MGEKFQIPNKSQRIKDQYSSGGICKIQYAICNEGAGVLINIFLLESLIKYYGKNY